MLFGETVQNFNNLMSTMPNVNVNYKFIIFFLLVYQNQKTVSDALEGGNTEHSNIDDSLRALHDASTQTDHSIYAVSMPSPSTQPARSEHTKEAGPLPPIRPYQCYGRSKRADIRAEIIEHIHSLLSTYVHGDNQALYDLMDNLLQSKKWRSTFGDSRKKEDDKITSAFLSSIVQEYQECKRKETNSVIRKQSKKLQQAIKISGTKSNSHIALQGNTPQSFKTRVDAANSLGRLTTYSAERRRLLSIVAADYPQTFLTEIFKCSKSTVTAARIHHILFGRGGVPPQCLKFTRQCVSQDTLDQLAEFLLRDDISRPSSCRSVVIDGKECPVRYWQSSIKEVIQHYLLEFPGNVKRSYIYAHIPKNFRSNTMLAGLCNLCEDYGYSNFANLKAFVQKLGADCPQQEFGGTVKKITDLQRYLKTKFSHEVLACLPTLFSTLDVCCEHEYYPVFLY